MVLLLTANCLQLTILKMFHVKHGTKRFELRKVSEGTEGSEVP